MAANFNMIPLEVRYTNNEGIPYFNGLSFMIGSQYIINLIGKYSQVK